jgi:hypothetical protein
MVNIRRLVFLSIFLGVLLPNIGMHEALVRQLLDDPTSLPLLSKQLLDVYLKIAERCGPDGKYVLRF